MHHCYSVSYAVLFVAKSKSQAKETNRDESVTMKHRMSLAYQGVTSPSDDVTNKYGRSISELDMSYNKVTDLKFLLDLPALKSLVLDHNLVTSQVKIPLCPQLEILWVNHNKIENLGLFIATLAKSCPNLRILSMMNNTAAPSYFNGGTYQQFLDYRYFVISNLPKMEIVDDRLITPEERSEALRLYPRPLVKVKRYTRSSSSRKKSKSKLDTTASSTASTDSIETHSS